MTAGTDSASLTRLQEDLLRAAFVVDESAVAAWSRWRDAMRVKRFAARGLGRRRDFRKQ